MVFLITGACFTQNDSAKKYWWLKWRYPNQLKKFFISYHNNAQSYPLDAMRTHGKKSKKMSKGLKGDRKKINNRLLAEQTILHMNLDGSIREVLPLRLSEPVQSNDNDII